jgi:Kef-type K+ transport system membrane component KefB
VEIGLFGEFGFVILLSATLGIIATKFKQPSILGYIITGLIIGPLTPFFNPSSESIELLGQVGIALLLFTLGLELNLGELKKIGKVALISGLGQIVFTSIFGYIICILLGFSSAASIYITLGLTFSSTIVIIKLLSAKNKLDTLYGKISIGFLLVQDFAAILILVILSGLKNVGGGGLEIIALNLGLILLKGIASIIVIYFFVKYILHPILNSLRMEKEVLFLSAIAWALVVSAIFGSEAIGFTIEVGALIAGIALSSRFEQLQIESWTRPLRDFFLTLFFVLLGAHIQLDSLSQAIGPALIFSAFVLIGNPIIMMLIMSALGYTRRTTFLAALCVAQISEFSLILINYAYTDLGVVDNVGLTIMTLVGGITMTISSYLIYYNEEIYERFGKYFAFLDISRSKIDELDHTDKKSFEVVLLGCHRLGHNLLKLIPEEKDKILIIDFDPQNIKELRSNGYNAIYGDIADREMYKYFHTEEAKVIISTVPGLKENKVLVQTIKALPHKPILILTANDGKSAKNLYSDGADYVIYPHLLSSESIIEILQKKLIPKSIVNKRRLHLENLEGMV